MFANTLHVEGPFTRTRVKVCCISSQAEARLAIAHGADALGLVGAMPSGPGVIDDAVIAALAARVPPGVTSVLLTSEITARGIASHVARCGAAAVQIVSMLDDREAAQLPELLPRTRILQVVHVEDSGALAAIERYGRYVHGFLLDSGRPSLAVPELGGTGRVHDWSISAAFVRASPLPVFLAGGIGAHNAADAIRQVRPYALDLCSSIRSSGALDEAKLRAFMAAVAEADRG